MKCCNDDCDWQAEEPCLCPKCGAAIYDEVAEKRIRQLAEFVAFTLDGVDLERFIRKFEPMWWHRLWEEDITHNEYRDAMEKMAVDLIVRGKDWQ